MTDTYEFTKSCLPQGVEQETPYVSKNWNYVNDINNGVYSNGSGLCLVQFDLSSIYNSTQMVDPSQMFMAIPITYSSVYLAGTASAATFCAPTNTTWASTGLKNGFFQILHGCDLQVAGKQMEQFQPNLNSYVSFKMLSQMSQDDLKTIGSVIGMGDTTHDTLRPADRPILSTRQGACRQACLGQGNPGAAPATGEGALPQRGRRCNDRALLGVQRFDAIDDPLTGQVNVGTSPLRRIIEPVDRIWNWIQECTHDTGMSS